MLKILLSPAKSLEQNSQAQQTKHSVSEFLPEAKSLITKLQKLSSKKIGDLMHISKDLSELNYNRFQNWIEPLAPTEDIRRCIELFNGEAYKGLDASTFSEEDMEFAQQSLRILSGLYGLLKPLDLIYPYRLEMGTKWKITEKHKNLYSFWGDKLSKYLLSENPTCIVNLASTEYFKAINTKIIKTPIITPIFKEFNGESYKVVMMYAKNARGSMARYIIKNKITNVEELKLFNENGYSFDVNQSSDSEWVFTR